MTHTCRGTVYLEAAHLSSNDPCHFVISNGSTVIHLRTSTETDKQRWMSALELAKQRAVKVRKQYNDSDEDVSTTEDVNDQSQNQPTLTASAPTTTTTVQDSTRISATNTERAELATMNKTFDSKLDDLKMCMDLINRHYQALHRTLGDLEQMDKSETTASILKSVNERATLFRITSTGKILARLQPPFPREESVTLASMPFSSYVSTMEFEF
jgi:oxysterol-binding protein 1